MLLFKSHLLLVGWCSERIVILELLELGLLLVGIVSLIEVIEVLVILFNVLGRRKVDLAVGIPREVHVV